MTNPGKVTERRAKRLALRRSRRAGQDANELDESAVPITNQPMELAHSHLSLPLRQSTAQNVAQRQGNGRLQRMLSTVQRKQAETTLQRKPKTKISTPVGKEAKKLKSGAAEMLVDGVLVTLLPDKTSKDDKLTGQAETNFTIDWGKLPGYQHRDGVVTKLDGKLPPIRMTIQTTYGVGAKAQDTSGYGRGTTEEDKAAGNTSLGFHEGQHGLDFIKYLKENPLPQFLGKVGMKVEEYKAAVEAYNKAAKEYATKMGEASESKTDCVGSQASFCVIE